MRKGQTGWKKATTPTRRRRRLDVLLAAADGTPEDRLAAFVARGRELAARSGLNFDDDGWEISRLLKPRSGCAEIASRLTLWFTLAAGPDGSRQPWPRSIAELAKAVCAGLLGQTSLGPLIVRRDALGSLAGQLGTRPVTDCTMADLDAAAADLRAQSGATAAELRIARLQGLAASMESAGIVRPGLAEWRPKRAAADVDNGSRRARLPTDGFSEAIARSFALAVRPEDVLVASACTIMQFVPTRLSAVLDLEEGCLSECLEGGTRRLLIRLAGSNGAPPCARWVPKEMTNVAEEAFERIHAASAEARAIKRWYDECPGRLYLPPHLERLRHKNWLTAEEASGLIGVSPGWIVLDAGRKGLHFHLQEGKPSLVAFADVERLILGRLPEMMRLAGGSLRHPLILLKWRSIRTSMVSECMFQPLGRREFSVALTPGRGRVGMLQRLGVDPSGTLKGNADCWRNLLADAAIRGGLDRDDLREWFARTEPGREDRFDHGLDVVSRNAAAAVSSRMLSGSPGKERCAARGRGR